MQIRSEIKLLVSFPRGAWVKIKNRVNDKNECFPFLPFQKHYRSGIRARAIFKYFIIIKEQT